MKMTTALGSLLALLLAATAANAAEKFYKWTDAEGVTHYSEGPPPDSATNASAVKVHTKLPSGSVSAAENQQKQRDEAGKADKDGKDKKDSKDTKTPPPPVATKAAEKYAEKCKQLQANLTTMQEHARVKVKDEKGEERFMTQEEKDGRLESTQREIKAYCQ